MMNIQPKLIKMGKIVSNSRAEVSKFLLVLLVVSISLSVVTCRPLARRSKPPFNGSIFGKRSSLPPSEDLQLVGTYVQSNNQQPFEIKSNGLQIELLKQQQQEIGLVQSVISRCLAKYESDNELVDICEELLATLTDQASRYSPSRQQLEGT